MFSETHLMVIDTERRYLDLNDLLNHCPGPYRFGNWKKHPSGEFIECFSTWMSLFESIYHNELYELGLHYQFSEKCAVGKELQKMTPFKPWDHEESTIEVIIRTACNVIM